MFCKRCGARLQQGVLVCPECGARQGRRASHFRCAYCGGRIAVGLAMCPHCGRNARPAGPRWGLWLGVGILIVLAGLWTLGRLPLAAIRGEVEGARSQLAELAQLVSPPTPAPLPPTPTTDLTATRRANATATGSPTPTIGATPSATALPPSPTPTAAPPLTVTGTLTTTRPATTVAVTATVTSTAPRPAATVTATSRPAAAGTTYRVQSGDTLADIGARFGVAWETIAAANNLTAATVLNIGQELVIPAAGAALPATATPRPLPTWTRTPAPPSAPPPPSLAAPLLSNPADGTPYSGDQAVLELVWQAVEGMSANGQYQVTLRWAENGAPQEHLIYTTATGIRVPTWLWQKADRPTRQYTWFVTAITKTTDGKGGERVIPLSPPSAARTFSWN